MKLSKTLVHSLREDPADVEMDSQKLLLKGGLIAKVDSGLYAFTPLGYRFLEDIQKVVENNSKKIGGSQISIPYVNNLEEVSEKNNGFILNSNEETLSFINFLK
ncbi:proline--tRNA ligase, partial [Clostridium botulinum]|nr:proline--tRNA ligase [Clostridium botulinum]